MTKLNAWKIACTVFVVCVASAIAARAQTFTTLVNFDGTNGGGPEYMNLIQGIDGNLYGTSEFGGANSGGTVFKLTRNGTLTTLYSFCAQPNCTDGGGPAAGLVLGTDGNFYGTAYSGAYGEGVVFKITPKGEFTTLHSFCAQTNCVDGSNPVAGLVLATDGNFYGTTYSGSSSSSLCPSGCGTVFRITSEGRFAKLVDFHYTSGNYPYAPLIQATNGDLYGTTSQGGEQRLGQAGTGTVYNIGEDGLSTIYVFCSVDCTDSNGETPMAGLFQAVDGNMYGTTAYGGSEGRGTVFEVGGGRVSNGL
jgi:uncharacterized repeat protein (TIGR03803 family)